jgi:hypothetical protein
MLRPHLLSADVRLQGADHRPDIALFHPQCRDEGYRSQFPVEFYQLCTSFTLYSNTVSVSVPDSGCGA